MGIFDALYGQPAQGNALSAGLLGLGAGLLQGSTGNYGQFGPALGQGLAGFAGGMQQVRENQQRDDQLQQLRQMRALQARQLQGEIAQQEGFRNFFSGGAAPSGGPQAFPVGGAGNAMTARIQQAMGSGNPLLMDWAAKAHAVQKEAAPRTQFDPNTGMLINLNTGTASPIMGPGGALQAKPDLTYDAVRGVMVDRRTGQAAPVMGPDGQPLPAQNNLEKPITEAQSKDLLFGSRAQEADRLINELTPKVNLVRAAVSDWQPSGMLPFGGAITAGINATATPEIQQLNQAKRDFINAVLRKESGAVIADPEFANADKQYFPQPGDSPEVIQQKAANRKLAARGILAGVPRDRRDSLGASNPARPAAPAAAPADGNFSSLWGG